MILDHQQGRKQESPALKQDASGEDDPEAGRKRP
jgi:hypothetical protein